MFTTIKPSDHTIGDHGPAGPSVAQLREKLSIIDSRVDTAVENFETLSDELAALPKTRGVRVGWEMITSQEQG